MKKIILSIFTVILAVSVFAQDKPLFELPAPKALVYDNTGFFTKEQAIQLNRILVDYDKKTSTQILVAVTPDLFGYDIDDYATRLLEKWQPGQKGKDNGIVILIKPKNETRGEVAISTGYGVEEYVTDAVAKRIIEKEIIPEFKKGLYFKGVLKAVEKIMQLLDGKFTPDEYLNQDEGSAIPGIIIMIIIFFFIFRGRNNGHHISGSGSSIPFWLLMGSAMGSRGSGGFGGFSSGSGGFGGFGGGMGGGGGASGSW